MDNKTYSPPSYTQATNPSDQSNLSGATQYNQYPAGYSYPSQGQYPGYTYGMKDGGQQSQDTITVVTQPGPVPTVISPVPHQDWMVPAVLACLCCFWPTGICAIMSASKANSAATTGDVAETQRQSRSARNLVILTVVLGIIVIAISITLRVVYYGKSNSSNYYNY
ncbi:uncharacterized protein LOC111100846 [Crassostrea virginica]